MKNVWMALLCGALLLPTALQGAGAKKWSSTTHEINVVVKSEMTIESSEGIYSVSPKKNKAGEIVPGCRLYFKVKPGEPHEAAITMTPKEDGTGILMLRSIKNGVAEFQAITINDQPLLEEPLTFDGAQRESNSYIAKHNKKFNFKAGEKLVIKFKLATPEAAK